MNSLAQLLFIAKKDGKDEFTLPVAVAEHNQAQLAMLDRRLAYCMDTMSSDDMTAFIEDMDKGRI